MYCQGSRVAYLPVLGIRLARASPSPFGETLQFGKGSKPSKWEVVSQFKHSGLADVFEDGLLFGGPFFVSGLAVLQFGSGIYPCPSLFVERMDQGCACEICGA